MAVAGDAPTIESVLSESFAEFRSQYTDAAFAATTPNADQIRTRLDEGPGWVALLDDAIVGTVSAVSRGRELYIRGMAVLPKARGHRAGVNLLEEIERYAATHGHQRLTLSTTPFLSQAIRLYENFGFRRSSEAPNDLFGTPLFSMEKFLTDDETLRS